MTDNNLNDDWWKQAVVYQIYPRSFKDANGDGLGDIPGITSKMQYLRELGIDAIWLSPFYPSDLADGGYDIIDYRNVDPRLGTMQDFDAMVSAAHQEGIKVIVDIVPNHTANKHAWFLEALAAGRGSTARERYIFKEGSGPNGEFPPNDWQSLFGGPAWERVEDGQWYLHIFAKEQPDLNWNNPEVHEEFKKTLRFWSDHGTDGFRVDVAHGLAKKLDGASMKDLSRWTVHDSLSHDGTHPLWDRAQVHDIYREWRQVFNEYNPPRFAVGEAWVVPEHQYLYASPDELGQVFNFEFAIANWFSQDFRTAIRDGLQAAKSSGSTATWVMSNHDVPRHPSRYGLPQAPSKATHQLPKDWVLRDGTTYEENRELGTRRARAAILMETALPGSVYIYQGEELGLFEVPNIPWDRLEDPTPFRTRGRYTEKGRDGCRVPLPWNSQDAPHEASWDSRFGTGASFGFSPSDATAGSQSADPHLPQPLWYKDFAVDVEQQDPTSMLSLYKACLSHRAALLTSAHNTSVTWLDEGDEVIAYTRQAADNSGYTAIASITNFGKNAVALPEGDLILSSIQLDDPALLPQDASAWIGIK
ncbi:glycoside hydrolase family 13 protein [Bifidobacterium crudilactis]|uniref:glycoside hydrolase family 13 protein n=1 Tax=Bifidobacterium crudilactis TaxID=327277 RepID=UPI000555C241|nr:glycoside hydrolase family 13 protein [Bifidobacterium crudilactis]MCI2149386.1 glycoside hydrolase family 13 protein [Bifidobacterium crudilactis]MCI2158199.1 glycoside hydrolase family 13 protein [Bifidobacterium crudilactis]